MNTIAIVEKNLKLAHINSTFLYKKSDKTDEHIFNKVKKIYFEHFFDQNWPKEFFSKIRPLQTLYITFLYQCAKKAEKTVSQPQGKLVTDKQMEERTDTGQ